jgi:hypothetical protein
MSSLPLDRRHGWDDKQGGGATTGTALDSPHAGAVSGILLVLLGAWGALIPFVGSYVSFSFTSDGAWTWTAGRGWLEVLPSAAAALGGLLLGGGGSRTTVDPGYPVGVYGTAIPLDPAKTVRFISLPTNPDLHVFAIG